MKVKKYLKAFLYASVSVWNEMSFIQRAIIQFVLLILTALLLQYYIYGEPTFQI